MHVAVDKYFLLVRLSNLKCQKISVFLSVYLCGCLRSLQLNVDEKRLWFSWICPLIEYWIETNLCVLYLCVDPAGAARSDPAAGRSDSPAAGPAGSAPANHHPAASDSHHRRTEPGVTLWPVECQNPFNQIIINMITECLLSLFVAPQGQQISVQGQQVAQTADGQTIVYQPVNADGTVLQQGKLKFLLPFCFVDFI